MKMYDVFKFEKYIEREKVIKTCNEHVWIHVVVARKSFI